MRELRQKHKLEILLSIAQLPRAAFYYHLKRMNGPDKYKAEKAEISAIYKENRGRYGYRRITMELHNRGFGVNHKTIRHLMKEMGLVCQVRIKKYRSYKGEAGMIAPNLLNQDFQAQKPNQKCVTNVTEFGLFWEKLYLSPILDLHNGYLIRCTISDRPILSMVTPCWTRLLRACLMAPTDPALRPGLALPAQTIPGHAQRQGHPAEHESKG